MVPGGLDVKSYMTREIPGSSLIDTAIFWTTYNDITDANVQYFLPIFFFLAVYIHFVYVNSSNGNPLQWSMDLEFYTVAFLKRQLWGCRSLLFLFGSISITPLNFFLAYEFSHHTVVHVSFGATSTAQSFVINDNISENI